MSQDGRSGDGIPLIVFYQPYQTHGRQLLLASPDDRDTAELRSLHPMHGHRLDLALDRSLLASQGAGVDLGSEGAAMPMSSGRIPASGQARASPTSSCISWILVSVPASSDARPWTSVRNPLSVARPSSRSCTSSPASTAWLQARISAVVR